MNYQSRTETVDWKGVSGRAYRYFVYPLGTSLKRVPGNYIYARQDSYGRWVAIYVGETGDLSERDLDTHHQRSCIIRNGATHIHAHESSANRHTRLDEETDLRQALNPPCNDQ